MVFRGLLWFWVVSLSFPALGAGPVQDGEPRERGKAAIAAPAKAWAAQTSATGITLVWQRVQEAREYRIYAEPRLRGRTGPGPDGTVRGDITRFLVPVAETGQTYRFAIEAVDRQDRVSERTEFNPVTVHAGAAAPGPVTGVTATQSGPRQVTLTWNAASGAVAYAIGRAVAPNGFRPLCELCPAEARFVDTDAEPGANHTYSVTAVSPAGRSRAASSNTVALGGETVAPAPPANPVATVLSTTAVRLNWQGAPGVTQYRIERSGGDEKDRVFPVARVDGNITEFTHERVGSIGSQLLAAALSNRRSPQEMTYRIIAVNSKGESAPVTFNYDMSKAQVGADKPPVAPSQAVATVLAKDKVRLNWEGSPGVTQYRIERSGGDEKDRVFPVARVNGNVSEFTHERVGSIASNLLAAALSNRRPPQQMTYRIIAVNSKGESAPVAFNYDMSKAQVGADQPPVAPSQAVATVLAKDKVRLNWEGAPGVTQYRIERSGGDEKDRVFPVARVNGNVSEFTHERVGSIASNLLAAALSNRRPPQQMTYRIIAVNSQGESKPVTFSYDMSKAQVGADKPPVAPSQAVATVLAKDKVRLTWEGAPGVTQYRIERSGGDEKDRVFPVARVNGNVSEFTHERVGTIASNLLAAALGNRRPPQMTYRIIAINSQGESEPVTFSYDLSKARAEESADKEPTATAPKVPRPKNPKYPWGEGG